MTFPVDDLRCHVLHSAAEGVRLLLVKYGLLAEPKVRQLDMAFRVQEDAGREKHTELVLSEALSETGVGQMSKFFSLLFLNNIFASHIKPF